MTASAAAREAYLEANVKTASPATLVVMLCDRMVLDVARARLAQQQSKHDEAHGHLVHAQSIVLELRASLKEDAFTGGKELAALYDWLHGHLVTANVRRSAELTAQCHAAAHQIAETWRAAAASA